MKTKARWITFVITAILMISLLGCAPQATTEAVSPTAAGDQPQTGDATEAPMDEATEPMEEATSEPSGGETGSDEPVTIRYANWNLGTEEENNIQRQMVAAYTEMHPNVTVEFVDMSAEGGWEAVLTSYAAKGELPDVFMANNVPLYVQNGWVADLTEYVSADPAWENVPEVLVDTVTYDGKVLGLPAAQFVMGYFVNKDLYEAANMDAPEYGFTVAEFEEAVEGLHDVDQGVLGLDEMEFIMGWYPNTVDPNLRWFGFDGEKMNYNSTGFKEGVQKAGELMAYTWQGLSEEQKTNFKSVGPWELFLNQEVGMRWDASWSVPSYVQSAPFEWDFIGFPGGNQALVADVMVVGATSENIPASYDFARWMTFSPEAYQKEAELARAMDSAPKMPVSVDDASVELYKEFVQVPGIHAALENLDASPVESLAKVIPGYINARWEGKPGIDVGDDKDVNIGFLIANANSGRYKWEDYSAQLEEFANGILADAAGVLTP